MTAPAKRLKQLAIAAHCSVLMGCLSSASPLSLCMRVRPLFASPPNCSMNSSTVQPVNLGGWPCCAEASCNTLGWRAASSCPQPA